MPTNRPPGGSDAEGSAAPIDLARAAPFALAHVTVTPATLGVAAPGWSQRLEPRAMQVLVVLAQASPAVVGRGELNARVWGGRVVGEDAINRAVQTLRRIAAEAPAPAPFAIGTIPRVGYRLMARGATETAPPADATLRSADPVPTAPPDRASRRLLLPWAMALLALVGATGLWRWFTGHGRTPVTWTITGVTTLDDLPPAARDVALSPDGHRLAYRARDPRGRTRIFVRAAQGGGEGRPVSPAGLDASNPSWSPDGTGLAFSADAIGRPCRLYVVRFDGSATPVGDCETSSEPRLAWSADGQSLLFGDAPGWNAVVRISAVRLADGQRSVLSSPPGDSLGDELPMPLGNGLAFRRQFGRADEGWVSRDPATGRERLLWRRHGASESVAAALPDGSLAIAWTLAGASGLDVVTPDGRATSQPVALGPVTAIAAVGDRLLVETDQVESALVRAGDAGSPPVSLVTVRGRITGPMLLPDGGLRFPVVSAGLARLWDWRLSGSLQPWSAPAAPGIWGPAASPDGRLFSTLVTTGDGREIVVLDAAGKPTYRWNPHARSMNTAAWSADGRRLIVPVLDGAGWRLFELDPSGHAPPRDMGQPGFAVLFGHDAALYAVRAGEATGIRELWRIDGRPRRLPIDLTLFDIVNWCPADAGVWLPDRTDRDHPRLLLRDEATGRVLRSLAAPGLAGPKTGLTADARGPVYVQVTRDLPEYRLLTIARTNR